MNKSPSLPDIYLMLLNKYLQNIDGPVDIGGGVSLWTDLREVLRAHLVRFYFDLLASGLADPVLLSERV